MTNIGGIEDASFNQGAWEGLQRLSGVSGCETLFLENRAEETFAENLENLVSRGGDLCWGLGYDSADDLLNVAWEHPDVSFAIVDNTFDNVPENVTCVVFRGEEPSFLVGYIAASVTKTGKVGFIGGEDNEVIRAFRYGFQAGCSYADHVLGKEIETDVAFAESFTDVERGKTLAKQLYDGGCDIIYHAAGQTGLGVIEAAEEAGFYVIGVDKDQSYLAPGNVLTSALKNVNIAVYTVSSEFLAGDAIGGKTIDLGIAEDALGVSEDHSLYPDDVYEAMCELKDKIASGELAVPSTEEEFMAFVDGLE